MLEIDERLRISGEGFRLDNLDCIAERCPASEVAIIRHEAERGEACEPYGQDAGRDDPGKMTPLEIARYRLKNAEVGAAIAATELHRAKLAVLQCEDEEAAKWASVTP